MNNPYFPLHSLPENEILHVLRNMEIYDQIAYSICSAKSGEKVRSLKLKVDLISLIVLFDIRIEVRLFDNTSLLFSFPKLNVDSHSNIHLERYEGEDLERRKLEDLWNTEAIDKNKLISHLCKVLNRPCADKIYYCDPTIPPKSISTLVQGQEVKILSIMPVRPQHRIRATLKTLRYSSVLRIFSVPFEKNEYTKWMSILMQNLDIFSFLSDDPTPIDDVLISNSQEFTTRCLFTSKQLNRFLKLWMVGSNRRFEYFSCKITGDSDGLLKGIEFERVPMDSTKVYKSKLVDLPIQEIPIKGGFQITRNDGTKAVVSIRTGKFDFVLF
uniref:FBA_2 domain-containing protein n=2 Tax=Caenorhabditis tropicalis TaxID=1561998 RepID=A0A1I7UUK5_9PELO